WLPSQGYTRPDMLPELNGIIDEAALAAGRSPSDVRRLYNINGHFGTGAGFLAGRPRDWAEQLGALALEQGMSTYILAGDDAEVLRVFGEEVAPAVRELVESARTSGGTGGAAPLG
ncbi:MAG: LLM class flavin-dependent oxidoreductase, partial [Nocardioidaceae bacterium]